jgi:hypothetical protein
VPLYELGVAAGSGYLPDYPAANEGRVRTLILPNFRYRGKILRADEESGVRARLFNNDRFDFDISFGGAFPVNAGDNRARKDMASLDWLVEFGPRLFTVLWHNPKHSRGRLALPIRGVFSTTGSSATYQGLVTVPGIIVELFQTPCERCRMFSALGPTIASEGVGDYFYEVGPSDATPQRPQYDARPGYVGTDLTSGLVYNINQWEIFVGGRISSYTGSANQRSPLFKAKENIAGFVAFGWLFYTSEAEAKP